MSQSLKQAFIKKPGVGAQAFDINATTRMFDQAQHLSVPSGLGLEDFSSSNEAQAQCQEMYESMRTFFAESNTGFENFGDTHRAEEHARITENAILAATYANISSADELAYRKKCLSMTTVPDSNDKHVITVAPQLDGPFGSIPMTTVATENYNEKSQRDFRVVSAMYNLSASRQDPFGEAAYKTVVVNPTEGGVVQNLTYVAVMQDVFHETTGALLDNGEVNMVEAFRNPSILEDKTNRLYPVVAADDRNKQHFSTIVSPRDVVDDHNVTLKTAPLKVNSGKFNLIGISNFALLHQANRLDTTDTIDPALRLKTVNIKVGDGQVVSFMVERLPTAVFTPKLTDDTRKAVLNFDSEDLILSVNSRTHDGTSNAALTQIADANLQIHLSVQVNSTIWTSKGDTTITAQPAMVNRVVEADTGNTIALSDSSVQAIISALGTLEVDSVEFDSRFTNTNRRKRGQLVQSRTYQFRYPIPMLSPITCLSSTMDEGGPGAVVQALTVAVNVRNSANAVTRLLNYLAQLRDVTDNGTALVKPSFNRVEGALSIMMRPTYRYQKLDLRDTVDSIRGKDRFEDICSTILNVARSMLYPAYRDSNIEAAFRSVTGNADEKPKFVILTDLEIGNYLMTKGDPRALGAEFEFDVVTTNNQDFDGKLVIIPTRKNGKEEDILNWGQFYYVPTIIADLPIARNGQISREIAAVPFNLHVNNIPFAIEIDVVGLKDVMSTSQFVSKLGQTSEEEAPAEEPTTEPEPTP
tara:strand:- start:839 stop:3097 length:2259 start_codon:yes stop_codon:yes gene_type:complete